MRRNIRGALGPGARGAGRFIVNASTLVPSIESRYGACSSYRDTGAVTWNSSDGRRHSIEFETFFLRPGSFRFDFIRHHPSAPPGTAGTHFSIQSNGKRSRFRSTGPLKTREKDAGSLGLAVAAGTGISRGASLWAHQLFFPDNSPANSRLLDIVRELEPEQKLADGTVCHVLRGVGESLGAVEVWAEVD